MPCTGSDDNSVYSICGEFKVKLGRSRIKGNSFIQIWDVCSDDASIQRNYCV